MMKIFVTRFQLEEELQHEILYISGFQIPHLIFDIEKSTSEGKSRHDIKLSSRDIHCRALLVNLSNSRIMQAAKTKIAPTLHQTISSFRSLRRTIQPSLKIGFVPTMGALHEGHLSLVSEARKNNDIVVASIFVNPTQFGPNEDFEKYPRQLERDSELLAEYGVDHLFSPNIDDMYGKNHVTYVDPKGFDDIPEGISRPGHFQGVATIVTKLFNIVQPTNAYFGQKDA